MMNINTDKNLTECYLKNLNQANSLSIFCTQTKKFKKPPKNNPVSAYLCAETFQRTDKRKSREKKLIKKRNLQHAQPRAHRYRVRKSSATDFTQPNLANIDSEIQLVL